VYEGFNTSPGIMSSQESVFLVRACIYAHLHAVACYAVGDAITWEIIASLRAADGFRDNNISMVDVFCSHATHEGVASA
jgi:hypothetical protein